MAAVTASMVKELRERTGLGMMECKKALVSVDGDIEKAIEELRKSSGMKAAKKASRTAAEGIVAVKLNDARTSAMILEVNSETDFVASSDDFRGFVDQVINSSLEQNITDIDQLMASQDGDLEVKRERLVQKIGENIRVRRIQSVDVDGVIGEYVHSNSKIAVLVALKDSQSSDLARDIAMHVAASNPLVVQADDLDQALLEKEREIYTAQAAESGKPADIVAKMVEGKLRKYKAEVSLLEQPFVKDPDQKVGALVKSSGAQVASFIRFEVGEGIERAETDFAAEVAAQVAGS